MSFAQVLNKKPFKILKYGLLLYYRKEMDMQKKYINLKNNEEIYIINPKSNSAVYIKRKRNKLHIENVNNIYNQSNIEITTINYEDLKRFILFNCYYLEMMSEDIDERTKKKINMFMNYHFEKVFGKRYNCDNENVLTNEYQCITTFDN